MDKMVVKKGKIFQAGNYPDKSFKVDPSELGEIVKRFTAPVPLDLNHHSSGLKRLDSKLGRLTSVWHDDKGALFGSVEIPEWLDNTVCKDDDGSQLPLPVSCAFLTPEGGKPFISKLALTDTPRVSDAAIFAAFSAAHPEEAKDEMVSSGVEVIGGSKSFSSELIKELVEFAKKNEKTNEGQSVIQQVHDTLARSGAVCYETKLHSATELSAIQKAHDEMMEAGAKCRILKEGEEPLMWFSSEMSEQPADGKIKERKMNSDRLSVINNLLRVIGQDGSDEETASKELEPKVFAKGGAILESAKIEAKVEEPKKEEQTTELSSELEELKKAFAAEQEKTKRLIADGIAAQSKILANEVINGKHAQEKDRGLLEAAFSQALTDEQSNPVEVQFSADKKGSRVDVLKALFSSKTIVALTEETVDENEVETLLIEEQPKGDKDETKARLDAVRERALKIAEKRNQKLRK
jgi:hypothetical protein